MTRNKRAREKAKNPNRPVFECAVCLSEHLDAEGTYSFSCTHPLCQECSRELSQRSNHRCPTCRAPREGMSEEQANEGAYIASTEEQRTAATFLQAQQFRAELRATPQQQGLLAQASGTAVLAALMMTRLDTVSPETFRNILALATEADTSTDDSY